jgi:Zn-dependent M28 family amino/carboxypeptidase
VTLQEFTYDFFQEFATPILDQTAPNSVSYPANDLAGFATMTYSGSADVTALVQATNDIVIPIAPDAPLGTSTSGCDGDFTEVGAGGFGNIVADPTGPDDFAGFTAGSIALVQRGFCTFALKATNALAAGAVGVIIFNEGQTGRTDAFGGTLGGTISATLPVVGAAFSVGEELYALSQQPGGVTVHMFTDTQTTLETTRNVIAESPGGRTDRVVVVGAHLDSVPEGPGINDNGSGSGAILEIALQMAELGIQPVNQVRFIWFSAEEAGLLGSDFYVGQLSTRQIKDIAVMLNFDMIGSPNYVRFVYDGDGSGTGIVGPNGSDVVEDVFLDYFGPTPTEPTAFDGRSDYGPFIEVGIPAGGLFTGAEELKTAAQAAIYGGTAGAPLDPCYHLACDTFKGTNTALALQALDQMSDAAAHAVLTFALTTSAVNGTDKGTGGGSADFEYLGSSLKQ